MKIYLIQATCLVLLDVFPTQYHSLDGDHMELSLIPRIEGQRGVRVETARLERSWDGEKPGDILMAFYFNGEYVSRHVLKRCFPKSDVFELFELSRREKYSLRPSAKFINPGGWNKNSAGKHGYLVHYQHKSELVTFDVGWAVPYSYLDTLEARGK
uniref:AlNc14C118G6589 protein n=1 Tax=Albugo laibachii Nc14 TaxID=890382 RepID=F0WJ58_9STRA|nr:AlNc14C118G6589 [Albugo laibachii Nc14]|eukprot:CCA21304.1 AlNc14C118G6589 [Albugo laibachii Nc14]